MPPHELALVKFMLTNLRDTFRAYMQELVKRPPITVLEAIQDEVYQLIYTFLNLTITKQEADALIRNLQQVSFAQAHTVLASCNDLAIVAMVECLQELPMNVFTDDEKVSLISKLLRIAATHQKRMTMAPSGSEPVIATPNAQAGFEPLAPEDKKLEKANRELKTALKFLHDELNIIAKRAKNYMRRQEV